MEEILNDLAEEYGFDRALSLLPDKATYDNDFILNFEYFRINIFFLISIWKRSICPHLFI